MFKVARANEDATGQAGDAGKALPYFFDQHVGETWRGKPILDHAGVIAHIDSGTTLNAKNGIVTYSFLDGPHTIGVYNNPKEGFSEPAGYSPMSPAEQAVARAIELSDTKYCSVAATVRPTAEITTSFEIIETENQQ